MPIFDRLWVTARCPLQKASQRGLPLADATDQLLDAMQKNDDLMQQAQNFAQAQQEADNFADAAGAGDAGDGGGDGGELRSGSLGEETQPSEKYMRSLPISTPIALCRRRRPNARSARHDRSFHNNAFCEGTL
jgi:hypothetical protein